MFKKKKTYVILLIIIAVVASVWYFKSKKPVVTYTTQKAEVGNLLRTSSVTGEITTPVLADLSFKLSGEITSLLVDVGDHVTAGQKIATIDEGTLPSQLAAANQKTKAAKKTLLDMKNHDSTYSHLQLEAQEATVKADQEAANQIMKQIDDTTLSAPVSGTVIKKNVEVGEMTVANAVTANTSVYTIASDGDLLAEVDVPESDIVNVKLDQKATVTLDALPSADKISASVSEIEPASTVIQDVVYYKVKLKFDQPDSRFKVGMSVNADILLAEKDNVVMIPQRAVKNDSGQDYVEVLNADGKTTQHVNISTGLKGDDGMVEVTSGLSGGEDVVVLQS